MTQNSIARLQTFVRRLSTSPIFKDEIQIPKKIQRGPTDILRALETTIKRDPTASHYKYHDDPFLMPNSMSRKRTYALSKESGKKAAMWILQEHANFLDSKLSDPQIECFIPDEKYNKTNVTEEKLMKLINMAKMTQALEVYHLLDGQVSPNAKQALLELLCYFNSEPPLSEKLFEERNFQVEAEPNKNVWIENVEIHNLFGELKSSGDANVVAKAYNAMICGLTKYLKADKAWQLYEECVKNNIPLALNTYNHLITLCSLMRDNNEERKNLLLTLLNALNENKIRPNIQTLNACLKTGSNFTYYKLAKELVLSLVAEFRRAGVKPSLATYYYMLKTFYNDGSTGREFIMEILDELEQQPNLEMRDVQDTAFFVYAMEVASKHVNDISIGDRIHRLLTEGQNYKFIGNSLNESIYYRFYMLLLLSSIPFDDFMKVYYDLVPHIYVPEAAVMKDIVLLLDLNDKEVVMPHIPKLLSDIVSFDMLEKRYIIGPMFKAMKTHCKAEKGSDLEKQYAEVALALWNHCYTQFQVRIQRIIWPATIFGDLMVLLLRSEHFDEVAKVLSFMLKEQLSFVGNIPSQDLEELFKSCLLRGDSSMALDILEYAYTYGMSDATFMTQRINTTLALNPKDQKRLENFAKPVGSGNL